MSVCTFCIQTGFCSINCSFMNTCCLLQVCRLELGFAGLCVCVHVCFACMHKLASLSPYFCVILLLKDLHSSVSPPFQVLSCPGLPRYMVRHTLGLLSSPDLSSALRLHCFLMQRESGKRDHKTKTHLF